MRRRNAECPEPVSIRHNGSMPGRWSFALVAAGLVLAAASLAPAVAQDKEGLVFRKHPYVCGPLDFRVSIPQGWEASHSPAAMAARGAGLGFRVTREPFLYKEKEFAKLWQGQLEAGGIETTVKKTRSGRYVAFAATWRSPADPGRMLQVYRLYASDTEMLYNVAFSLPSGAESKQFVKGVLRSFQATGFKRKTGLGKRRHGMARIGLHLKLPPGYEKVELPRLRSQEQARTAPYAAFHKVLPGYKPPRETARLHIHAYVRGDIENHVTDLWARAQAQLVGAPSKPRLRKGARYGEHKGVFTSFKGTQANVPRRFYVFGMKTKKGIRVAVTLLIDEREIRLYKNVFKDVCSNMEERGG